MPSVTITLDSTQTQRLTTAWMKVFSTNTPPSIADVKTHLVRELRAIVQEGERQIALEAIIPTPFDPR